MQAGDKKQLYYYKSWPYYVITCIRLIATHIEGINNLVDVNFDPNQRIITCTFLNQPFDILKHCSANITYGDNCERFLNIFSGTSTGNTVATQQLEAVPGVVDYCFLATAKSNNVTVLVDGTLQNLGT